MGSTCLVNKTNKTEVIMKIHKPRDNTSPFFNKDWFYLRQIKSKQKICFSIHNRLICYLKESMIRTFAYIT